MITTSINRDAFARRRLLCGCMAAGFLACMPAYEADASARAVSLLKIDDLTITPGIGAVNVSPLGAVTGTDADLGAANAMNAGGLDPAGAGLGTAVGRNNSFVQLAGTFGNFSYSDALVVDNGATGDVSAIAEAWLDAVQFGFPPATAEAETTVTLTRTFDLTADQIVTIEFDAAYDLFAASIAPDGVIAETKLETVLSITGGPNNQTMLWTPTGSGSVVIGGTQTGGVNSLNQGIIRTGGFSSEEDLIFRPYKATSGVLKAGTYTFTLDVTAYVSIETANPVPEPAALSLAGVVFLMMRRRRA